jgi:hypothetical protein
VQPGICNEDIMVRAKFTVVAHTQNVYDKEARNIRLEPVYDMSIPEDVRYSKATPSGHMELYVSNPTAIEQMALGTVFYVDFTPVSE